MNHSLENIAEPSDEEVKQRKFESYLSLVGLGLGGGLFLIIILAARMNIWQIFTISPKNTKVQHSYLELKLSIRSWLQGVVIWITREQRVDSETMEEAQKLSDTRRAGRGMSAMDVWGKQRKAEAKAMS